ncbi:MAG TPA: lipid-A-disaccharide synthase [Edaphobacter sp.]|nr:lipid-A-disaccharide synthase [Edaphobacter sp.]
MFLSAGEASGDHYGAQLIAELRNRHPHAACFGLGGKEMEAAGLNRIVRAEDVAHMGITEVVRHMPRVYGAYRSLVAAIRQRRPEVAILIDFPDVNFRLARELKKLDIPVVYFVSPQLWAWKRRRLRWVQQRVNRMMVIFPFEERFYQARNVNAKFVGHPLAELPQPSITRKEYAAAHNLDPAKPWIALLPGSRWKEVTANLEVMMEMVHRFPLGCDYILPVASTIDRKHLEEFIAGHEEWWPGDIDAALKLLNLHLVPDARDALYHARASVVASGTATVQAAVLGNPFVVVYRVSALTFRLAKRLVHYPPEIWPSNQLDADGNLPIAMVNLIAGRRVVPELLQSRFTAENVAAALGPLLADGPRRNKVIADLAEVRLSLQPVPGTGSIQQVVNAIDALLLEKHRNSGPNPTASV